MQAKWIEFPVRGDARGRLIPMEAERAVPFAIRRAYALVGLTEGGARGGHAHRRLQQLIVALTGSCKVTLDDGRERLELELGEPNRALLLEPMVWHEMKDFSPHCVLLVLADQHYDEADYIRDWGEFLRLREGRVA